MQCRAEEADSARHAAEGRAAELQAELLTAHSAHAAALTGAEAELRSASDARLAVRLEELKVEHTAEASSLRTELALQASALDRWARLGTLPRAA